MRGHQLLTVLLHRVDREVSVRVCDSRSSQIAVITGSGYLCSRAGEASAKITTPQLRAGLLLTDHLNSITVPEGASLANRTEAALDHKL
jgi:hypothetical protein